MSSEIRSSDHFPIGLETSWYPRKKVILTKDAQIYLQQQTVQYAKYLKFFPWKMEKPRGGNTSAPKDAQCNYICNSSSFLNGCTLHLRFKP
jgi:hypothetical protein